ncbi:hypothetical protein AB3N60_17795 [Leptospira sp. WS39.C2]
MKLMRLGFVFFLSVFSLFAQSKTNQICNSFVDCEKKSDSTSIHRKKIMFLSNAISAYSKDSSVEALLSVYLKRTRSILLEANGDTGYSGEIVLKVSHKPEYKQAQLLKAEEDLKFIEDNMSKCSTDQIKEFNELKDLLQNSK